MVISSVLCVHGVVSLFLRSGFVFWAGLSKLESPIETKVCRGELATLPRGGVVTDMNGGRGHIGAQVCCKTVESSRRFTAVVEEA